MPEERRVFRRLVVGLTVPLLGAALLWWIAGSDTALARWISIVVIAAALGGWYLSQRQKPDE